MNNDAQKPQEGSMANPDDGSNWDRNKNLGEAGIYVSGSPANELGRQMREDRDRMIREDRDRMFQPTPVVGRVTFGTAPGPGSTGDPSSNLAFIASMIVGGIVWYYAAMAWGFGLHATGAGIGAWIVSKFVFSTEPFLILFNMMAFVLKVCLYLALGALVIFFFAR
jgi:hypothetical protein